MSQVNAPPSYDAAMNDKTEGSQVTQPPASIENANLMQGNAYIQPTQHYSRQSGFDNVTYKPVVTVVHAQTVQQPAHVSSVEETGGFTVRASFSDMDVRRLYIRKVFMILGLQLFVTFGFVCLFYFVNEIKSFVQATPAVYYAAYIVFLVMYFVLVCSISASRQHPWNLVMLIALTLAMSYMVGTISSFYNVQAVFIGLGVTVVVCVMVMAFSIQTKFDFTKCAGLLFILLMVLIIFGFITIFTWHYGWYLQVVYGCLGALVFTLFLAFDTQLVMGGRKYELHPEEYVFGALVLYIDIIYIFLFILSIFGGGSK